MAAFAARLGEMVVFSSRVFYVLSGCCPKNNVSYEIQHFENFVEARACMQAACV